MKKALLIAGAAIIAASAPAFARVNIGLYLGAPEPTYVEPTYVAEPEPTYVEAPAYPDYYHHRHYHHGGVPHDFHHDHHR